MLNYIKYFILVFFLCNFSYISKGNAATIQANSCSRADVLAAINSASDGDTVTIPSGSCTWNSAVTIEDKGITIKGAGIDQTIIKNGTTNTILIIYSQHTDPTFYLSDITFDANNKDTGSNPMMAIYAGGADLEAFRFYNLKLDNLKERGLSVGMEGYACSGLIDNCTFNMPTSSGSKAISVFGTGAQEHQPFGWGLGLGGAQFIFVEACTFNFDDRNDGALDAYGGARYVFRHNTVIGTNVEHHGADSGGYRGTHSYEIYENTFSCTGGCSSQRAHHFRSGTGVVFNNTYTGNYTVMDLANYRSCGSYSPHGECSGGSGWDGNDGYQGYPCLDQIGHIFDADGGAGYSLEPLYEWGNTRNGADIDFSLSSGPGCARHDLHIVANRDYYNDTQRPGYTPYTYPHPLTFLLSAPNNFRFR